MICQDQEPLIAQVCELYERISRLESLKPSKEVNALFTELVNACTPPNPIDVTKLCKRIQTVRSSLIILCGRAEGLLESHYSSLLSSRQNPLHSLHLFPYYSNYLKLAALEHSLLSRHFAAGNPPAAVAFVGSGPLPLTSIVLAKNHLGLATFHNYDIDPAANAAAEALVSSDEDLAGRMFFHTADVMEVAGELGEYDAVFLAALVGMDAGEKARVVDHLSRHMSPGALLVVRSAHGARAFLYPVVEPRDLRGFEVLQVHHPSDEVINSVVVARKFDHRDHNNNSSRPIGTISPVAAAGGFVLPTKCCHEIQFEGLLFNPMNVHGNMVEELAFDDNM